MLEVATLTPQYNAYWQQLYEEAFPAIERFEFETLQQLARQHEGLNLGIILDGARPVGLVVYQLNTQNVHQALFCFLQLIQIYVARVWVHKHYHVLNRCFQMALY